MINVFCLAANGHERKSRTSTSDSLIANIGALREPTRDIADSKAQRPNLRAKNAWATFLYWLRCASIPLATPHIAAVIVLPPIDEKE